MKKLIIIGFILGFANLAFGTSQANDILKYNGKTLRIPVFPLEDYGPIAKGKIKLEIKPNAISTAYYRGYVATWEIWEGKLYLIEIEGWIRESFDSHKQATLELLFPGKVKDGRVHASWFSGKIFSPGHRLYGSFSKEVQAKQELNARLIITVKDGVIEKIEDKETPNKASQAIGAPSSPQPER